MRWILLGCLASACIAAGPDTQPTTIPSADQARFELAQKRLADRLKLKAAVTTQPTDDSGDYSDHHDPGTAVSAIKQLCADLNTILAAGDLETETTPGPSIDAAFGNLDRKPMHFSGTVFGLSNKIPGEEAQNSILVLVSVLPPADAIRAWQTGMRDTAAMYDERSRSLSENQRASRGVSNRPIDNFARFMGINLSNKADALRRLRDQKPNATTVEVYLLASDEVIRATKKNQVIAGSISFRSGVLAATRTWGIREESYRYAATVRLTADLLPQQ